VSDGVGDRDSDALAVMEGVRVRDPDALTLLDAVRLALRVTLAVSVADEVTLLETLCKMQWGKMRRGTNGENGGW
jgi:hypothetical protein